jgi:hypothetical protein
MVKAIIENESWRHRLKLSSKLLRFMMILEEFLFDETVAQSLQTLNRLFMTRVQDDSYKENSLCGLVVEVNSWNFSKHLIDF